MIFKKVLPQFLLLSLFSVSALCQSLPFDFEENTEISGNWFLNFNYNKTANKNKYGLKRGYFTVKTKLSDMLSTRYTQDITLDEEGSDAGNVEMRLKYLYIKAKMNSLELLKDSYFEMGLVHRPWIDYDGHINDYRLEGKMFMETHKIINSADFGLTYVGLLGGKISREYQEQVSDYLPGKYGSFAIGVYNGGGYHAIENNNNKTLEGRLSLRPIPTKLPGLQFSYAFALGKNNFADSTLSDFDMNLFYASYESESVIATAQYYFGIGSYEDSYIDQNYDSYKNNGFSLFTEIMIPKTNFALMGRYDRFESVDERINFERTVFIGGIAYNFLGNKILFDYRHDEKNDALNKNLELVLEISF